MLRELISNLRVRFLLLVLLALLPALGLLLLTASESREQAIQDQQENVRRLAVLAAADQNRVIESTRQLLTVLSRVPEVQAQDDGCSNLLATLLGQFPIYANLGVIDANGAVVCSAVAPPRGLNLSDRDDVVTALATSDFAVSGYRIDAVAGVPVLNASYPLAAADGAAGGVVYASINLQSLATFATAARPFEDTVLTVIDRDGTVLARQPQDDVVVGQSLRGDPVFETVLTERTGDTDGRIDGRSYLFAFAPLGSGEAGNAYVVIAIPRSEVLEAPERLFSRNLTRLGLVVLVVLVAAWVGGDLLGRRNADLHKEVVRRIYDAFTTGAVDVLDDVVEQDFVDHDPMPGQSPGLPGLKQAVGLFRAAFHDGEMLVDELIAERDLVVARVTLQGTHSGDYFGRSGSNRWISADGVEIFRVRKGKVCEGWSRFVVPLDGDSKASDPIVDEEQGITRAT
ncbi:MAG: ester cyclase [Chloroflexota bacterium]|nr:ester cyclase [Chloroflexota bacterium]